MLFAQSISVSLFFSLVALCSHTMIVRGAHASPIIIAHHHIHIHSSIIYIIYPFIYVHNIISSSSPNTLKKARVVFFINSNSVRTHLAQFLRFNSNTKRCRLLCVCPMFCAYDLRHRGHNVCTIYYP